MRVLRRGMIVTVGLALLLCASSGRVQGAGVGEPAPAFGLLDVVSKRTVRLEDLRGRTVLMWVWDTVCPLCLNEGKSLDRFAASRSDHLTGLLIIERGDEMDLEMEGQIYQPRMHLLVDKKAVVEKAYGIKRLPVLVIVDRAGRVRYRGSYKGDCHLSKLISRIENRPRDRGKEPTGCL